MRRWMGMPIAAVLALTACVTINVYFPAAEAREAAKEFVDKVIGDDAQPSTPAPASDEPAGDGGGMVLRFDPLMLLGLGTAHAQGTPDIRLKTPTIPSIQPRRAACYDSSLPPTSASGALRSPGTTSVAGRAAPACARHGRAAP